MMPGNGYERVLCVKERSGIFYGKKRFFLREPGKIRLQPRKTMAGDLLP